MNIGGSYKLHSLARWVAVLEHVEQNELKRVHKIEGNDEDYKLLMLDKVNHGEKLKILLKRRPDRMGLLYRVGFGEKKPEAKKEAVQAEIVSKEEAENFNMVSTSTALSTLDDNTHHIMTWLAQNPAFEVVDVRRRKSLTYINEAGEEEDKDREFVSIYEDVWIPGDRLKVYGPVCDHEDMKLYALLVKELAKNHASGSPGLSLQSSVKGILTLLNLEESGKNLKRVKRQLNRLVRMSLEFRNNKGSSWFGPLVNDIQMAGDGRSSRTIIEFNRFMINFYRLHEYSTFSRETSMVLRGDSASFYIFYSSHSLKEMSISVEKCKKLLAIPESFDKKEALKRVKKAVQDLIDAKVMQSEKTFVRDGKVHTCLLAP